MDVEGSHKWVPLKLGYIIHHVLSRKWRELRMRSTLSRLRHGSSFAKLEHSKCVCRLDIDIDSDGLQRKGGPRGQRGSCLHTRRKNLLGDLQSFLLLGCCQTISDFLSQNIFDMDYRRYFQPLAKSHFPLLMLLFSCYALFISIFKKHY
jgi:hypothetical protein